jgi:hypothetical protein
MNVQDYLKQVADVKAAPEDMRVLDEKAGGDGLSDCYFSKFDGSFITMIGQEDSVQYLADRQITDELTHGVGFSPKDGKWYGWSHRAIYGFEVGSTCKKGDCHYRPANLESELEKAEAFWDDECHSETTAKVIDGEIRVFWVYNDLTPNMKLRGTKGDCGWHHDAENYGRGEWVAETMEDAKEMAIDFNEGVS